ncbi:catalase [Knoellia sp. CPCC 206450]|uniref:catalase n=1 Tax=Knoellia tibetensis TaxID=3404798 RepID=UPI003B42EE23
MANDDNAQKPPVPVRVPDRPVPTAPGAPGPQPPQLEEPVEPRGPLPPKPDQGSPEPVSPTGAPLDVPPTAMSQQDGYLTTSQGLRVPDTDHSLKAGARGPTLLQDHHLREKITHFDHERIPERVVHARGAGAHGTFTAYGSASGLTKAGFLEKGVETPVFVRFSTVLGSRGSADTVRDTRGFATKFYTTEGTFDLVGNNIPVFFIQDGIKFPDIVHAAKPHPDREIPQAQSAHDTFWDFVSLHTEAQHHTMWNMSDRGIPRSYRTMEGFGVHTFRLVNEAGETSLVKFHWKPRLGVHSLTWEEAQELAGKDPDYHRRDLYDAIEAGAYPQWELGVQVMPDDEDQMFEGIDLLDATKLVPEELAPVQPVGMLTLTANPTNFFAEVEQVAFHVGHLVPGIDVTDDPLLQTRLFSYVDTQLTRLGGPNFSQIPVNRPHAPVNDMLRDGFHQHAVHGGVAPYRPNSLDGGCPFIAGEATFIEVPAQVPESRKVRESPASFDDHYSQVRQFWQSMSPVERDHITSAYTFELGRCFEETVRTRQLQCLAEIDDVLVATVAEGLGLPAPTGAGGGGDAQPSAALSQVGSSWPVEGRLVGVVADATSDAGAIARLLQALTEQGARGLVIAPTGGTLRTADGELTVQRTLLTATAAELDALVLAAVPEPGADARPSTDSKADPDATALDPRVRTMVLQAYRHAKPIGVLGVEEHAQAVAEALGLMAHPAGVALGDDSSVAEAVLEALAQHRVWDRFPPSPASVTG